MKFWIFLFILLITTVSFAGDNSNQAAKPSLWERFTNFFDPEPSVTENGELEQKIRELDKKISTTRSDFRRENRPQRKTMLRKELEDLTSQRDSLLTIYEIRKTEKSTVNQTKETSSKITLQDSSSTQREEHTKKEATVTKTDTIRIIEREIIREIIRDTIYIRDTIFLKDSLCQNPTNKEN